MVPERRRAARADATTVLQMIAVDDLRKCGALAFTEPLRLKNRAIDIAGDAADDAHGGPCPRQERSGRTISFGGVPRSRR